MLRCPPSRIHLTLADLDGLDERLEARRAARIPQLRASNFRLSPGPARPARLSLVSADQNIGRKRALSSSSEAVLSDASKEEPDTFNALDGTNDEVWTTAMPEVVSQSETTRLAEEAVRVLDAVAARSQPPTQPTPRRSPRKSPRRNRDSLYEERREIEEIEREIAGHSPASRVDGTAETELGHVPVTPGDLRVNSMQSAIQTQAHQIQTRALSSARARHRNARSIEDPSSHHEGIRPFSTQSDLWRNPVPQLVLPTEASQASLNPIFDPNAPVFVPRTRFGTTSGSSILAAGPHERPWRSLDHTSSSSNLRMRSSGELNIEPPFATRNGPARQSIEPQRLQPRTRQRSRTSHENEVFPSHSPNLERYPLLQPAMLRPSASFIAARRQPSTVNLQPDGTFSRAWSNTFDIHEDMTPSLEAHRSTDYHVRHAIVQHDQRELSLGHRSGLDLRAISPALSTSSRSTPNLLQGALHPAQTHSRGSSLSWRGSRRPTPLGGLPRQPWSAGSSLRNSPLPLPSRHSSREGLDAAVEFMRMRSSPLDELTERLSHLATRQRSVGRSWERLVSPRRHRVSLLSGDPFRQQSAPQPPPSSSSPLAQPLPTSLQLPIRPHPSVHPTVAVAPQRQPAPGARDCVTDSVPPASATASSSPPLIALPRGTQGTPSPTRAPLAQLRQSGAPTRSSEVQSSPSRSPARPVTTTPPARNTFRIYDDALPAIVQPQTPADIVASSSRQHHTGQIQQHTYPPPPPTPLARQRVSDENGDGAEVVGRMSSAERERQVWLSRRDEGDRGEAGGLEETPPGMGRFERELGMR